MRKIAEYKGHKIVASDISGRPQAIIYRGQHAVNNERLEADSIDTVIEIAKERIEQSNIKEAESRRAPHVASPEKYANYIRTEGLKDHERSMLLAHAKARTLTATELAASAGWDNYSSANIHYGYLGRAMSGALGLELPVREDGSTIWTMALAEAADDEKPEVNAGHFRWAIHPELVQGLLIAGELEKSPEWLPAGEKFG